MKHVTGELPHVAAMWHCQHHQILPHQLLFLD